MSKDVVFKVKTINVKVNASGNVGITACKHCGATPVLEVNDDTYMKQAWNIYVCSNCSANGGSSNSEEGARRRWNEANAGGNKNG